LMATRAPRRASSSAIARPMPRAAPVTNATLLSSSWVADIWQVCCWIAGNATNVEMLSVLGGSLFLAKEILHWHHPAGHGWLGLGHFTASVNRWVRLVAGSINAHDLVTQHVHIPDN